MSNNVQMTSEAARSVKNVDVFEAEVTRYINAAVGTIIVRTREPVRCAETIHRLSVKREAEFKLWACNKGWQSYIRPAGFREGDIDATINTAAPTSSDPTTVDPSRALEKIFTEHLERQRTGGTREKAEYFCMFYPHHHFDKPIIHQWVKDFGQLSRELDNRLFLICPDTVKVPPEMEDDVYIMDFLVPSFAELRENYDTFIEGVPETVRPKFSDDEITGIIQNGLGMTYGEFETAIALAVVTYQGPNTPPSKASDYVALVLKHKIEVIKKTDLLELMPPASMKEVGGFDTMKAWLDTHSKAFSQEARDYGIEIPKGMLCVGPPGTGKSFFAKATASVMNVPLVKFDIGKVFGKFVGESEGRIRQAIKIIEAMAPCVLLVDEIDKGFGGLSSGGTDGGTSMRVLGSFLNWMQDRDGDKYPVFIIMTANNVQGLPPELMRRGRIDEIFACTFPGHSERKEIVKIHLEKRGHKLPAAELDKIAAACDKYVGAEIEAAIKNALLDAFIEKAEHPTSEHVVKHLQDMVPLSKAFADKMQFMHEWAKNNAKPASSSMNFDDLAPSKDGAKPALRKINVPGKGGIRSRGLDG